ncbi:hypothetical protein DYB26_004274 [Aphanomyces astaci]|uniref:Uncharacterized protein n=1 Tax=Aphanomyces astaci TaxID=112090 RepID=A0A3R6ZA45_APHAT|nr:hypothetical protein DYB26_004274 [Aphanomyces astaci]
MIYLAKSATAQGVVNLDPGLPPWRPITVQSTFSSRIFTVIRDYISPCIPNEEMQHGFQRDRTVQDAVVLTCLLIERAERRQEELFLISKDCLKCFDRIPGWVMEYIYRKLGPPYRTAISDAINISPALDTLFRKTARRVLRLPHDHPNAWFFDPKDGLGLIHCERFSHSQRLYQFLLIANDRGSPAHDILMESLEAYQLASGLTDHPLAFRIPPPASDTTFLGTLLRDLATFQPALTIATQWHQPPASRPHRPNDRPIWAHLTLALGTTLLISLNRSHNVKVRWVGDITNEKGTMLLSLSSFRTKFGYYLGRDGTTLVGTINIHPDHITPTRCEIHSLLAGLHHSGDVALQICHNTTAIGLIILARSLKRRGGQPRYSNIHRVELRSLMDLLTITADTSDPVLRAKQALLEEADSLATLAHQLLPRTNYAHLIIPDPWELRDNHNRPVTGAIATWLGAIYGNRNWSSTQARKPDARRTIQPSRLNTGELCKWNLPALSIYWRAICYTLHTNARKHRIKKNWDAHCRTCPDCLDTQEHHFGLTHPQCPGSASLTQDLLLATQAVTPKAWLPDLDIYLPGQCNAITSTFTGQTRPQ